MANRRNIEHILDRAHIQHLDTSDRNRSIILETDKIDCITIKQLINEGVTEFTAILSRGIINILIEY